MITLVSDLTITNQNFSIVLSHAKPARIIIAVPHDGLIANDLGPLFKTRSTGTKGRDAHVWPIVNDIVCAGHMKGVRVDSVRFLMPRAYVDANRSIERDTRGQSAFDDPNIKSVYEGYHQELRRLVERSIRTFGVEDILLIDLHGFGKQPRIAPPGGYELILGTANRATIRHGDVDRRFAEFMRARGYQVFLPETEPVVPGGDPFGAVYTHTARWYAHQYGINTIQVETFSSFRKRGSEQQGEKLAHDIVAFLFEYYYCRETDGPTLEERKRQQLYALI